MLIIIKTIVCWVIMNVVHRKVQKLLLKIVCVWVTRPLWLINYPLKTHLPFLILLLFPVAITVIALSTLLLGMTDAQRHRFYPQWPSFSRGEDVAQDPNSVDDSYGWSWGASNHGNHRHHPQAHNNPDFNFESNEFNGGFNNQNFQQQQQQQNPRVPSTRAPVVAVTTPPAAATTAATPPGKYSKEYIFANIFTMIFGNSFFPATNGGAPVSATSVVYSDEFYDCMSQCRTTNEWNPVCGSDNNNYNNIEKLNCANSCGGSECSSSIDYKLSTLGLFSFVVKLWLNQPIASSISDVRQVRQGPCRPA